MRGRVAAIAGTLVLLASASPSVRADPFVVVGEGVLGVPLEPGASYWDYRTPTTLLDRKQFDVFASGDVADLLARTYRTGRSDGGYAIGVSGGAVAPWQYGVTGVWALGSGQSQTWHQPTGLYTLTPSPKIGALALSHAWKHGPWAVGGTIYRTSFSLSDTFVFNRFPTSSNRQENEYLYDLLPAAIGPTIAYDAIGNRVAFYADGARSTPIGTFGAVLCGWYADADWITEHTNTITDTQYGDNYLAGPKDGDGHGGWNGTSAEVRWSVAPIGRFTSEVRVGRAGWRGDATMWLRNQAILQVDQTTDLYLEPRDWGIDSVTSDSWRSSAMASYEVTPTTRVRASLDWERHNLSTSAFGRTPVLGLLSGYAPIEQGAYAGLDGRLTAVDVRLTAQHRPETGPWAWDAGLGVVQFDGWANTSVEPVTVGFQASSSAHHWALSGLRLGYVDVEISRFMTQQIRLTYSLRQYVPISGSWRRDGVASAPPGGIKSVNFGSLHELRVEMQL